ncbi:golgin subfamily A member 2-like [Rhopilema esculentum]|uniref:golgin subfamily A member 2-like n=1 Tax=Rhopilema esculentum TaxID=499914 RepID=UPI0031E06DDE
MSETSRQEKLASAKRKLKQFQQRKTPSNSPAPNPSPSHSLQKTSNELMFGPGFQSPYNQSQTLSPQSLQFTPKKIQDAGTPNSPAKNVNGDHREADKKDGNPAIHANSPDITKSESNKRHAIQTSEMMKAEDNISIQRDFSPAEKIKHISNQLNGMITKDILLNADEQILKELGSLEKRNNELESSLQSYKRSNQQLTNQLNEQRKMVIQYQEKLKKEKSEGSGVQSQELRAAKEQLEVHIQTIGILVSDKSELQENLKRSQKKLQKKEGENEDLQNRLQAVRQRVVELERNLSNLQMNCEKYQKNNKDLAQELEKSNTRCHSAVKEKEDLSQQTSELREILATKSAESDKLQNKVTELTNKLQKAENIAQQLSSDSSSSESWDKLHTESDMLKQKLSEQTKLLEKLSSEKGEILERNHLRIESLELAIDDQRALIEKYENRIEELESKDATSQQQIVEFEKKIAEMLDKEAMQQTKATHLAAGEIEKLTNEKSSIENELDIQVSENRRLSKLVLDQDERIQELESAVARLGEDAVDRVSLLEDMQSDKETISRAMQQNKALKDQLEQLERGFVKTTNSNAELTTSLQKEQHLNTELASKLSEIGVELEEKKAELQKMDSASRSLQTEISELRNNSSLMETNVDSEKQELLTAIEKLQEHLDRQIQQNEKLRHLEGQLALTDKLHTELQSAQDTINLLSIQNGQLREQLRSNVYITNQDDVDSGMDPRRQNGYDHDHNADGGDSHLDDHDHSDVDDHDTQSNEESSEEVDHDSYGQQNDSITQEVLYSYRNAIGQLEADRDELYELLQKERQDSAEETQKIKDHMEMQLQQQLKQQLRHVQEHYHQQIHEQQLQINKLQETIDDHKRQENIIQADVNDNGINFDTLKIAFHQLQNRFKSLLDEKIALSDKLQEMEHSNFQLASETETIGEYINLYRTQRLALKDKFLEKDRLISQLSNEHSRMQSKISHLQELVMQTLAEKSRIEEEKVQLQELVNKRLAIQSGEERETEIPKFDLSNNSLYDETISFPSNDEDHSKHIAGRRERTESETSGFSDGKRQQIMQLFEQLNDTGEGYQRGWLSPAVRRKEFTPCKHCGGRTINL